MQILLLGLLAHVPAASGGAPVASSPADRSSTFFWGDADGDDRPDALVLVPGQPARLLLNRAGGEFEDATDVSGLADLAGARRALWEDFDGDGDADLLTLAPDGEGALFENLGGGSFRRASATGLDLSSGAFHAEWLDLDADGLPDLHVADREGEHLYRNAGGGTFEPLGLSASSGVVEPSGPAGPHGATGICVEAVEDLATGVCVPVSSVPTAGALYPLGPEFHIDPLGYVGIGTMTPGTRLDVAGDVRSAGQLISTVGSGPPLAVSSTDLVPNLNADRLDGLQASEFSQFGSLVESSEIADGTITAADLAASSVGSSEIADEAVGFTEIAAGAVDTIHIADAAVVAAKLAAGSVTGAAVLDGSLTQSDLATGSVSTSEILDGTVTAADLAASSVGAAEIASGAVGFTEIAAGAVDTIHIAGAAVVASKLAAGAVTGAAVLDGSLSQSDLATGSVATSEILDGTIVDADVSGGAGILGTKISPNFGSQDVVTTGAVGAGTLSPGADLHVQGDSLLGSVLIAPDETASGDDSELLFGEDHDGTFGMKWLYDGGVNQLRLFRRASGVDDPTPHVAIERDTGNTSIGNDGFQQGRLTVNGTADGLNPAIQVFGGPWSAVRATGHQTNGAVVYGDHAGTNGYGVWGVGDSGGGVYGQTDHGAGVGVFGYANFATGSSDGVWGHTENVGGYGVYARNFNSSGTGYGIWAQSDSETGRGIYALATASGSVNYGVRGATSSTAGYGVYSIGDLGASGVKSFLQPHPTDPSLELRFVCLEGNESGTYFRGSETLAGGVAVIEVPEEFRLASEPDEITVQVTPMGPANLWVVSKSTDEIVVGGTADVEFDYFVNGIRRGFRDLDVVRSNTSFVPEERGVEFGTQYPAALRQILVENGILNPDFTPNEATAATLGWELRDGEPRAEAVARSRAIREAFEASEAAWEARQAAPREPARDE